MVVMTCYSITCYKQINLETLLLQYAGINIGPVHKKDVMKASVMLEHDPQ